MWIDQAQDRCQGDQARTERQPCRRRVPVRALRRWRFLTRRHDSIVLITEMSCHGGVQSHPSGYPVGGRSGTFDRHSSGGELGPSASAVSPRVAPG